MLGLNSKRTSAALQTRVDAGLIVVANVFKRDRWEAGYKIAGGTSGPAGTEISVPPGLDRIFL